MITVIHGPAGCGKTRNAEALKRAFGCRRIVDGWEPGQELMPIRDGDLILTNTAHVRDRRAFGGRRINVMSYAAACAKAGLQ